MCVLCVLCGVMCELCACLSPVVLCGGAGGGAGGGVGWAYDQSKLT